MAESLISSRWEDNDRRSGNRVVRVIEEEEIPGMLHRVRYVVEVAEFLPKTIGRRVWTKVSNLTKNYTRISRD